MHSESAESAEIFRFFQNENVSFNFLESLLNCVYLTCDFEYLTLRCNVRRYIQSLSAKMTALGLLKVKIFRNKDYDVIMSVHDVTNKILLHHSNYIVDVAM